MRLGGPIFTEFTGPEDWVVAARATGYTAVYCPARYGAEDEVVGAYARAAAKAHIVIAEVGAWSNPISPDEQERNRSLTLCKEQLALADRIGARCCVNISGARGDRWDGHYAANLTQNTFDLIVDSVREIIDDAGPLRTFYTLETMPWMYPDSVDSYVRLLEAIDRKQFGVHLDPANLINSPERFYGNADLLRECFAKLGPHIKSCHAKDVSMRQEFMVHIDEVRPGLGSLDYGVYLRELDRLPPDTPLMMEHLSDGEDYDRAAEYIRSVAAQEGVKIR